MSYMLQISEWNYTDRPFCTCVIRACDIGQQHTISKSLNYLNQILQTFFIRHPKNHYDVTLKYLVFKIVHFVELNRRYQPAKFDWPRLSESNFTRVGGTHLPPPPNLHDLKKPGPYRVKYVFMYLHYYTCKSKDKGLICCLCEQQHY